MKDEGHSRNALEVGTVLNGVYRVEAEFGQGGFGIVYRAHHTELDYPVAIKEYLPAELAIREGRSVHPRNADCREHFQEGMRRFLEEAKQLIAFRNHPNIVSCRDFFRGNGTAYLVMEYEEGLPLSELLRAREEEGRPFGEEDLRKVMVPLLEGLRQVHEAGVLHRDIKPGNILVRRKDERPVLIDFGAAKQNFAEHSKSLAPFTEGYAAIEQVGEGKLGPWTDLYAVGAVMWRMVAGGNRPFEPPNPVKVESRTHAVLRGEADPLPSARELGRGRFSERVLGAIDQCLELREADRVQSCAELLGLLRGEEKTAPVASQPRPAEEAQSQPPGEAEAQPSRAARRYLRSLSSRWTAAALVMLAVAAILGLIFSDQFLEMRRESVSVEWVKELLEQSPSEITEGNRREPCMENPTIRCLIGQAIRVARGIDTSQRAEAFGRIVGAFNAIASAQVKAGDVDAAGQTLTAALEMARRIDNASLRAETLVAIAMQALAGDVDAAGRTRAAALDMARSIDNASLRAETLVAIAMQALVGDSDANSPSVFLADGGKIVKQALAGDIDAARRTLAAVLEIARSIDNASLRAVVLAVIANEQALVGDSDAAGRTLTAALEMARSIDNASFSAKVLAIIARAQALVGDVDAARQTLAAALESTWKIDNAYSRANALVIIAVAQANSVDGQAAKQTFAAALAIARNIDSAYSRADALSEITSAQARVGHSATALETSHRIDDALEVSSYVTRLTSNARAQARAGHFAAALAIARNIDSAYFRVDALAVIAFQQVKAGDIDAARQTLAAALESTRSIDDAPSRAHALAVIAFQQVKAGDIDAARQTLAAALESTRSIDNAYSNLRAPALTAIARVQVLAADIDAARRTLTAAHESTRNIGSTFWRAHALNDIALEQAKAGDRVAATYSIGSALEAFDVDRDSQSSLLMNIATTQAKIGLVAAAFKTAQGLDDTPSSRARTMALRSIAHARAELGDFENATKAMMAIRDKGDRVAGLAVVAVWLTEIRICPPLDYGNSRLRHPLARLDP